MGFRHAALALLAIAPSAAHAAPAVDRTPIVFAKTTETSREAAVVRALNGGTLDGIVSGVADIDSDGAAEIVVKTGCTENQPLCRTRIFSHRTGSWAIIFDQISADLAMRNDKTGSMRNLVSQTAAYTWNGRRFVVDASASGTPAKFEEAPEAYRDTIAAQFGQGARKLASSGVSKVEIAVVSPAEDKTSVLAARLTGGGACGTQLGCPLRLLSVVDGKYKTLLEGVADDQVVVTGTIRKGWSDILVTRPEGRSAVYGWSGQGYVQAAR
jgi:hypothetical protein